MCLIDTDTQKEKKHTHVRKKIRDGHLHLACVSQAQRQVIKFALGASAEGPFGCWESRKISVTLTETESQLPACHDGGTGHTHTHTPSQTHIHTDIHT